MTGSRASPRAANLARRSRAAAAAPAWPDNVATSRSSSISRSTSIASSRSIPSANWRASSRVWCSMNCLLQLIDTERKLARVEPGLVLDELQKALVPHGLIFGPDPATHSHCAIGGMLGNNSCGVHSVMAEFYGGGGPCFDNVHELEVLLYDGTILRVGKTDDVDLARIKSEAGRRGEIYKR